VRRDTEQLRWTLLKWARENASRHAAFRTLALGAHRASCREVTASEHNSRSIGARSPLFDGQVTGTQSQDQQTAASSAAQLTCVRASLGLSCLSVEGLRRLVASYVGLISGKPRRTMRELALHLEAIMDDGSSMEEEEDEA